MNHRGFQVGQAIRTAVVALALLVTAPVAVFAQEGTAVVLRSGNGDAGLLVYHQLTNLTDSVAGVGQPVLSANGERGVFTDSPARMDPATPNHVYSINADGTGLTEIDTYQPLCNCRSLLDISDDGATIVFTDAMQVRIADGGGVRQLLQVSSNEITAIRLSGDGQTVFLLVRRDTSNSDGSVAMPRGVWAIEADGSDLRQLVGPAEIADHLSLPIESLGCCLHGGWEPLDVSTDGSRVVFGAYGNGGETLFAVNGDGSNLHTLSDPMAFVRRVVISGDGGTVGYDVIPLDTNGQEEIGVIAFDGSGQKTLGTATQTDPAMPLQISADGSRLLLSSIAWLYDTTTGDVRQLAVLTPGAGSQTALVADGIPRATMNADASRFLYVIDTVRCADCANQREQLATLDIGPAEFGAAPLISDTLIDPAEVVVAYGSTVTVSAAIDGNGEFVAAGLVALRDGLYDVNVGRSASLFDDGTNGDADAGDGVFTNSTIQHSFIVAREDDTGPRTIRIQAEVMASDGLRHATALDAGTLTVVAS